MSDKRPKESRATRNIKTLLPDDKLSKEEERAKKESKLLEKHLINLSPFNGKWQVQRTLSSGAYGVVFLCTDIMDEEKKGVVKVAHQQVGNETAGWEAFIMEKVTKYTNNKDSNIVRLLDKGILIDNEKNRLNFMVLEYCEISVKKYLAMRPVGHARTVRTCQVLLGALKGIFDLHNQGLLHRDLKPENMGILSKNEPVVLLYDLGMARMYTDNFGEVRPPRTVVPFKGTIEWASGHALKGREQSRWDDLVAWLYIAVELFDPNLESEAPYPWDNQRIKNTKAIRYLKSTYAPARLLLKNCPRQFYAIHTYLMCASRLNAPNYEFIAKKVGDALTDAMGSTAGDSAKRSSAFSGGTQSSTIDATQRSTIRGDTKRSTIGGGTKRSTAIDAAAAQRSAINSGSSVASGRDKPSSLIQIGSDLLSNRDQKKPDEKQPKVEQTTKIGEPSTKAGASERKEGTTDETSSDDSSSSGSTSSEEES